MSVVDRNIYHSSIDATNHGNAHATWTPFATVGSVEAWVLYLWVSIMRPYVQLYANSFNLAGALGYRWSESEQQSMHR